MEEPSWHVEVDRATCMGTGTCTVIAARHFALVDGRAEVTDSTVSPDDVIIDAADSCPSEAILVRDARSGKLIAPQP